MASRPLRIALVGCGAVMQRYHAPAVSVSPDVEVTAVVDPVPDRARALQAIFPRADLLDTHLQLHRRADAAIVAVPNALHAPVTIELAQQGLHVLVEKPMACSVADCDRMEAVARSANVTLAIGHDFRHFPVARYAKGFLEAGMIGPVTAVDVQQNAGRTWPSVSAAVLSRESGGVLLTFGVHVFDLLSWWLGPLRACGYADDAAGGVEADCEIELAVESSGAPIRMALSRLRRLRDTILLHGERGSIEIGVHEPAVFRVRPHGQVLAVHGAVPDDAFDRLPMRTVFARQLQDFVRAVRTTAPPLVTAEEGRRAVALVEACYRIRRALVHPWDSPAAYLTLANRESGV